MKKIVFIILISMISLILLADTSSEIILSDKIISNTQKKVNDIISQTDKVLLFTQNDDDKSKIIKINEDNHNISITSSIDTNNGKRPYIGVYYDALNDTFKKKVGYKKEYGIRIIGIVPGSPADEQRLGKNDILMKIGEYPIKNYQDFGQILGYYNAGDTAKLKIFRMGKEIDMDFTFGFRKQIEIDDKTKLLKLKKKGISLNGGIFWTPAWLNLNDKDDIDKILKNHGYKELSNKNIFTSGFAVKINPQKNYTLGFSYQFFEDNQTDYRKKSFYHPESGLEDTVSVKVKSDLMIKYVGGSLDRKIFTTKKFKSSLGFMLGFGQIYFREKAHETIYSEENGDSEFTNNDPELNGSFDYQYKKVLHKDYLAFQPRVTLEYILLDHIGIRAEAGYMFGYPISDWEGSRNGDSITLNNFPETNFDGYTISIGPWFSF